MLALVGTLAACGGGNASPPVPPPGDVTPRPSSNADASDAGTDAATPRLPSGGPAHGGLPPLLIQRVIRAGFPKLRTCYEAGLDRTPGLRGRVKVRFVIELSGAVSKVEDYGSDLPDADVVACVVRGFGQLSFPPPDGRKVTVVYPINFSEEDDGDAGADVGAKYAK